MTFLPRFDQPTPCLGKFELFDSRHPAAHAEAKALCDNVCPAKAACWDHLQAVRNAPAELGGSPEGTWAGHHFGRARMPGRRAVA